MRPSVAEGLHQIVACSLLPFVASTPCILKQKPNTAMKPKPTITRYAGHLKDRAIVNYCFLGAPEVRARLLASKNLGKERQPLQLQMSSNYWLNKMGAEPWPLASTDSHQPLISRPRATNKRRSYPHPVLSMRDCNAHKEGSVKRL